MHCERFVSGLGQSVQCPCRILSARPRRLTPANRLSNKAQIHDLHTAKDRMCPLRASKGDQQSQNKQKKVPQVRFRQTLMAVILELQSLCADIVFVIAATRG